MRKSVINNFTKKKTVKRPALRYPIICSDSNGRQSSHHFPHGLMIAKFKHHRSCGIKRKGKTMRACNIKLPHQWFFLVLRPVTQRKTFDRILNPHNCWLSFDVIKIQTKELLILLSFYFHDVLEQQNLIFMQLSTSKGFFISNF